MKRKIFGILFALVLVLSLSLLMAVPAMAQPADVWVDDDYCNGCGNDGHTWGYDAFDSIQAGVNAVDSGGTVHVAEGTYDEAMTIPAGLTGLQLLGAQAGIDARGAMGGDGWYQGRDVVDESIIDAQGNKIVSNAGGMTMDGFTIQNVGRIEITDDNNTIRNNIIIGKPESGHNHVIWPLTPTNNFVVERNWIKDTDMSGVHLAFGADGLEIVNNLFTDMGYSAVILGADPPLLGNYINTLISGNQIKRTGCQAINIDGLSETGLTIEDNIIESAGLDFPISSGRGAIRLYNDIPYENVLIRGNELRYSLTGITVRKGVVDWADVVIENNYIGYNDIGILVEEGAGNFGSDYTVRFNAIVCNTECGLQNNSSEEFNAVDNWWGCWDGPSTVGPGSGQNISDDVSYEPWLTTNPIPTIPTDCYECPTQAVGGKDYPVNKVGLIAPWIALAVVIAAGGVYLVRCRAHN